MYTYVYDVLCQRVGISMMTQIKNNIAPYLNAVGCEKNIYG